MVVPPDDRSIARTRACLVSAREAVFGDFDADRLEGLGLLVFRTDAREVALVFDLGLVMGSSEVMRRYPSHHLSPARVKPLAGQDPEARLNRPKSPQQHSKRARKPVNSEQDSC